MLSIKLVLMCALWKRSVPNNRPKTTKHLLMQPYLKQAVNGLTLKVLMRSEEPAFQLQSKGSTLKNWEQEAPRQGKRKTCLYHQSHLCDPHPLEGFSRLPELLEGDPKILYANMSRCITQVSSSLKTRRLFHSAASPRFFKETQM